MPDSTTPHTTRHPYGWLALTLGLTLGACGEDVPDPTLTAQPPTFASGPEVEVEATHGGSVVVAGDQPIEVVPHASGEVHAYVVGAPPPPGAELAVTVPVRQGVRTVELEWNPANVRFEGRVRRVEVVPGPVDVVYVAGGTRWVGHAPTVVIAPAVVVAPAAEVEVEVAAPREVIVTPPSPRVVITPPSPRVVITPPAVQLEVRGGKHRKHRKHRGRGRGHGHADVRVRIR